MREALIALAEKWEKQDAPAGKGQRRITLKLCAEELRAVIDSGQVDNPNKERQ